MSQERRPAPGGSRTCRNTQPPAGDHLAAEQRRERGIVSLPETLGEAIDALAHSELAKKALGPHIFDRYVELKRKEWDEYRVQLTDWERDRYLAVL